MNISETVNKVIELRQHGGDSERRVAEYLKSTLWAFDAQVNVQPYSFSLQSRAWTGGMVLLLSVLFFVSVLRRWRRAACLSAVAIAVILFLEFSLDFHVVSWPVLKKSENIIADFPVQQAARRVIVGTNTVEARYGESGRFEETVIAFLLPATLIITLLGLWQLATYFGKLDFEDAHTIMMISGAVCLVYYALAFGVLSRAATGRDASRDPKLNAGSVAVLASLAEDLSQKYPRLENTWVTVVFFGRGGPDSHGARLLARKISRERKGGVPTYFIGCEQVGRGGPHGYLISEEAATSPLFVDREMVRTLDRAAVKITGRQLEIVHGDVVDSRGFVDYGYPTVAVTTLPRNGRPADAGSKPEEVDRGQLLLSLQLLEAALLEFEMSPSP